MTETKEKAFNVVENNMKQLQTKFQSFLPPEEEEEVKSSPKQDQIHCATRRPRISYEAATWIIFGIFTTLAIIDRFTTNVWPRQSFQIGSGSAGSDRMEGYKPGPWSVVAYDVLARLSGRFSICCFNLLLITRMKSLEWWLTTSWVGKYVLDCSNIINANIRLHRWNAIALCVLTLLHVWSILLPCITHGWSAQVVPGKFEYPISERTPKGFKDANPETETMSLQVDDVFRMVEMTLFLAILTPLSVRWLATHYHIGMPLHRFIMVVYFVDIVRRHSHPHSWVLNTPVFLIWMLDKVWSSTFRRQNGLPFRRVKLGKDYMVLYWNQPHKIETVGGDFYFKLYNSSMWEDPHVFTTFENRTGLTIENDPYFKWTNGTVIRVFRSKRAPQLGRKDGYSHTMRMYEDAKMPITVWGPTYGEMSEHVQDALLGERPVVLVAAGSGIGYALDALQFTMHSKALCRLTVLFTTRDAKLFEWVKQITHSFASPNDENLVDIRIVLALTGGEDYEYSDLSAGHKIMSNLENQSRVSTVRGRLIFANEIEKDSVVFCQGSGALKTIVAGACKKTNSTFHGGRGGGL